MEAGLTTTYKKYYYGENEVPEQQILPCLEVVPNGTFIENIGTGGMVKSEYTITINIKNSVKNFYTKGATTIVRAMQDMVKKMEERDGSHKLKSTTVLGILHNNLKLSSSVEINGDWRIVYDKIEVRDTFIVIGSVTFTAYKINDCI